MSQVTQKLFDMPDPTDPLAATALMARAQDVVVKHAASLEPLARLFTDPGTRARLARNARAEAERWTWRASSEAVVGYYEEVIAGA